MKDTILITLLLVSSIAGTLQAVEEADPAMAVMARMREQLRSVMIQQQKTEADRATLEAANVDLEAKLKSLDAKFKLLAKESNEQKDADAKTIADLKAKVMQQEGEQARLAEALAKWKAGYQEVTAAAKNIEAQRAEFAARVILMERKVADHQRKNDELFKIGSEVLSRYQSFGLGTAIAAREPFTRNMRVKLETLVQDYSDKLIDNKIKPEELSKKASSTAPASKSEAAAVQAPVMTTNR